MSFKTMENIFLGIIADHVRTYDKEMVVEFIEVKFISTAFESDLGTKSGYRDDGTSTLENCLVLLAKYKVKVGERLLEKEKTFSCDVGFVLKERESFRVEKVLVPL